jgi:hypothetical protein
MAFSSQAAPKAHTYAGLELESYGRALRDGVNAFWVTLGRKEASGQG